MRLCNIAFQNTTKMILHMASKTCEAYTYYKFELQDKTFSTYIKHCPENPYGFSFDAGLTSFFAHLDENPACDNHELSHDFAYFLLRIFEGQSLDCLHFEKSVGAGHGSAGLAQFQDSLVATAPQSPPELPKASGKRSDDDDTSFSCPFSDLSFVGGTPGFVDDTSGKRIFGHHQGGCKGRAMDQYALRTAFFAYPEHCPNAKKKFVIVEGDKDGHKTANG